MTGTQRLGSEVSIDSPTAERHMGHIDTSAAQTAHILRWRHGSSTTVLGCSRHTTHDEPPSSTSGGGDAAAGGGTAGSLWAGPALLLPRVPRRAAQETANVQNRCPHPSTLASKVTPGSQSGTCMLLHLYIICTLYFGS